MYIKDLHPWNITPSKATQIQNQLRNQIIDKDDLGEIQFVAGMDIGLKGNLARASIAVLRYSDLEPVDLAVVETTVSFPYVPGLLSFRETPLLLEAAKKLRTEPDLIIADGHGLAHPRRFGIACHLGLILDKPAIGCAKSRLCGTYSEPGNKKGSSAHIHDKGEIIGAVLRSRSNVSVVYVSVGHRVSLETAIELTLSCCKQYRIPETTRYAHKAASGEPISLVQNQISLF
ncbi:MAG: deoxyribonuclease V [Candidatus Poribacteria bacterium]|nr:deoxyribonuclease V [Candidatus Poribacteria bacterium]